MTNPDPWFIAERPISNYWIPLQIYRYPAYDADYLLYAVSTDRHGNRYLLKELRGILAAAEQAERDFSSRAAPQAGDGEQP